MLDYEVTDHHHGVAPEHAITENHWDNIINKARQQAKDELEIRKQKLVSEEFYHRQKTTRDKVLQMIDIHTKKKTELNHFVRQETMKMKKIDPDFSYESDDSDTGAALATDSSKIIATEEL